MKIFLILILFFNFSNVFALEFNTNFTKKKFEQAQSNGKTVVVYSWNKFCGTCKQQKPILKQAIKDFKNVLFLDFEHVKNKDIAEYLKINFWSTIAVYKDNKEIAKAIGLQDETKIYSLIKKGI